MKLGPGMIKSRAGLGFCDYGVIDSGVGEMLQVVTGPIIKLLSMKYCMVSRFRCYTKLVGYQMQCKLYGFWAGDQLCLLLSKIFLCLASRGFFSYISELSRNGNLSLWWI